MSAWLSLNWSVRVATAVPLAPPIACHHWSFVAFGFFAPLLDETPTGVPCAATVPFAPAPPGAALPAGATLLAGALLAGALLAPAAPPVVAVEPAPLAG